MVILNMVIKYQNHWTLILLKGFVFIIEFSQLNNKCKHDFWREISTTRHRTINQICVCPPCHRESAIKYVISILFYFWKSDGFEWIVCMSHLGCGTGVCPWSWSGCTSQLDQHFNKDCLRMLYFAFVVPHFLYGLICWRNV